MTESAMSSPNHQNPVPAGAALGIMQPYFFPYLGYFSLIAATDEWIVFDPVQFIRHGWIERNRILKPGEGWQYVGVPLVKQPRETLIKDVVIKAAEPWRQKLFRQCDHYRKRAPYYAAVIEFLQEILKYETDSITKLNTHLLKETCGYIGIDISCHIYSEMDLVHEEVTGPGEWALNISKALRAKRYINPPGGAQLFDKEKFKQAGIELLFLENDLTPYSQRRPVFEAGLSVLDAMMFCSPSEIKQLVENYRLTE